MRNFGGLKVFDRIWVVGPQRSGTRIVSKMIAHDLKCRVFDEREFAIDSLSRLWIMVGETQDEETVVIHGPGITRWVHMLASRNDAVIFMMRAIEEIKASERRIDWLHNMAEAMKYDSEGSSAEIKQAYWYDEQRDKIAHPFTVIYPEDISGHPLWVDPGDRAAFTWDQTKKIP